MRPFPLPLLLSCLVLSACDQTAVVAQDAVVQLPAVAGRPGVAYFSLRAPKLPERLLAVTSPRIDRIELHESGMIEGAMRMGPLEDTNFPDGGEMVFEPGGKHAMLFGVDPALKPGDTVTLRFDLDKAPDITIQAPVEGPGGGNGGR